MDSSRNRQYEDVTQDQMMKTAVKIAAGGVRMAPEGMKNLFEDYMKTLNHQSGVRTAMMTSLFFLAYGAISETELASFREKMIDVIKNARAIRRPETVGLPEVAPNEQNQDIEIIPEGKERSFAELSDLLAPGQERRFAEDNFNTKNLDALYDTAANPGHYAEGVISRFIFKIGSKISSKDRVAYSILDAGAQFWKDDGLAPEVALEGYYAKKEKNNKNRAKFSA